MEKSRLEAFICAANLILTSQKLLIIMTAVSTEFLWELFRINSENLEQQMNIWLTALIVGGVIG